MLLTVISFLAVLLILLTLSRLASRWLVELFGYRWYRILLWPGVVAHELSHLVGALLTFTRVTGISLLPQPAGEAGQVLGSVTHQATRNPVTLILISLFPFLGGSFILWVLALALVPGAPLAAPVIDAAGGAASYLGAWWQFVRSFTLAFNFVAWQSWLFLYLTLAIAAHLAPSNRDLSYTAAGFTALSVLAVLFTWGSELISPNVGERVGNWLTQSLTFFLPLLSYAFAVLAPVVLAVGCVFGVKRLNERKVWW